MVPYPVDFQLSRFNGWKGDSHTVCNKMQIICLKTLVCVAMSPKD